MAIVYKLTREDYLEYIGISKRPLKIRVRQHEKTLRFRESKILKCVVLFEGEYADCEIMEEFFINVYDTYKNGLNITKNGKGKNPDCKFNTLGFVFSEETKQKMSISAKKRARKRGYKLNLSDEQRNRWSNLRKEKRASSKLSQEDVDIIKTVFEYMPIISQAGKKQQNGRVLPYKRAFSNIISNCFSVDSGGIYKIVNNESWKNV